MVRCRFIYNANDLNGSSYMIIPEYLYHYTSISALAAILKNETIKFNNLTKVDDLEESMYSKYGKYVFVSCWTDNDNEDIPTWIMYGNKMNGVRIKLPIYPFHVNTFNPEDFKAEIPAPFSKHIHIDIPWSFFNIEDFTNDQGYTICPSHSNTNENKFNNDQFNNLLCKIDYTDDENILNYEEVDGVISNDFLIKLGYRKRISWKFQQEWRYKIVFNPYSTIDACKSLNLMISRIAERTDLPFDSYFMKMNHDYFNDMEITMGPCSTDSDWYIVEQLLLSKGLDPAKIIKHSSLEGKIRNFI